jgi:FMN hydrolase / 5-amino-6-(5-phospho-D-ribitylamino)uracil phosphatase
VRLVTFDGDDTLWAIEPVMEAALRDACQAFAEAFPGTQVTREELLADRLAVQDELPPESDLRLYRRAAYRRRADLLGGAPDAVVDQLADRFHLLRSSLIEPYPDALGVLERLSASAQLGFITNGNADVEATPFAGRFAFRLHALVHGPSKPDVGLFMHALARSGVPAQAAVHVGDSLSCDVAGAQAAGFRAVWLNRDGLPNRTSVRPDAEITSLDELDAVVDALVPLRT